MAVFHPFRDFVSGLSTRTKNCLANGEIENFEDLLEQTPKNLMRILNFGRKSLIEIETALADICLKLSKDHLIKKRCPTCGAYLKVHELGGKRFHCGVERCFVDHQTVEAARNCYDHSKGIKK